MPSTGGKQKTSWGSWTFVTVCLKILGDTCPGLMIQSLSCVWPHGLQQARLPCPSPTLRVYLNSCALSQWCHPAISSSVIPFSFCLQSFPASGSFPMSQFFAIRWPKYCSFSFSISSSNEYSGLISFRIDWLDHLAVQETLKSLLQCHSSKASILRHSALLVVQLSHPYTTAGKTIALTRRTFVCKVMSLPFNMLSRLVIAFLSRRKCLLVSWLQSPSEVILEPPKMSLFPLFPRLFAKKWWNNRLVPNWERSTSRLYIVTLFI